MEGLENLIIMAGVLIVGLFLLLRMIFGPLAMGHFWGEWLFVISKAILLAPFKIIAAIFRWLR